MERYRIEQLINIFVSKQTNASGNSVSTVTTYDGLGRLKSEVLSGKTKSYNYDYYGNRSSMFVTGEGSTGYVYDKNNRLTKQTQGVNGVSTITEYWYDPNGNQISSMSVNNSLKDGTNTAVIELAGRSGNSMNAYNSWNQLTSTMQNGKTSSYTYNGDGLRMSKTVNGVTTSHMWDGMNIAGDVTNGTVTKYIRGLQLISSKTGSSESYYNYNAHGDVVQLTNSSGSITKQYSYDAFGVQQDKADDDTNPFRYCGEYMDAETGLIYLRARYYDPEIGAFVHEDPIKDGLNWYSYCAGNPVGFVDPFGMKLKIKDMESFDFKGETTSILAELQKLTDDVIDVNTDTGEVFITEKIDGNKTMGTAFIRNLVDPDTKTISISLIKTPITYNPNTHNHSSGREVYINSDNDFNCLVEEKLSDGTTRTINESERPLFITIAHELIHSYHYVTGKIGFTANLNAYKYYIFKNPIGQQKIVKSSDFRDELDTVGIPYIELKYDKAILYDVNAVNQFDITENDIRYEHNLNKRITYEATGGWVY